MTRISLRALEPTDVDCLYIWENDPEMWRYGFSPAPYSRHQLWEYVQQYDANPLAQQQLRLMVDLDGTPVGTVDLYNIDIRNRHTFTGIMIAREHRRKNIAIEALRLLAEYCRNNLGLSKIAAAIAEDNEASLRLFAKAGYEHTAVIPAWIYRNGNNAIAAHLLVKTL